MQKKIMDARRKELSQEINNEGVIFQQLFFETHNSDVSGQIPKTSAIYPTLSNSFPDRQLAILINQLEAFSRKSRIITK